MGWNDQDKDMTSIFREASKQIISAVIKMRQELWPVWLSWLSFIPCTERSLVLFLVKEGMYLSFRFNP